MKSKLQSPSLSPKAVIRLNMDYEAMFEHPDGNEVFEPDHHA
jgi:hypothetical protein